MTRAPINDRQGRCEEPSDQAEPIRAEGVVRPFGSTPCTTCGLYGGAIPAPTQGEREAAFEVYADILRAKAPKGEYVAATVLDNPSPADERTVDAMLAYAALRAVDAAPAAVDVAGIVEKCGFNAGYLIAVANLMNLHGSEVEARDTLEQLGVDRSVLAGLDLTEYDTDPLNRLFDEIERRAALSPKGNPDAA